MSAPTPRQIEVLAFIASREHRPPTLREISAAFGFRSHHSAHEHLRLLKAKGLVDRGPKQTARAMRVTPLGLTFLSSSAKVVGVCPTCGHAPVESAPLSTFRAVSAEVAR